MKKEDFLIDLLKKLGVPIDEIKKVLTPERIEQLNKLVTTFDTRFTQLENDVRIIKQWIEAIEVKPDDT